MNNTNKTLTSVLIKTIRHIMITDEISVTELADSLGVSRQRVSAILRQRNMMLNEAAEIMDRMGFVLELTAIRKEERIPAKELPRTCPYSPFGILHIHQDFSRFS